MLPLRIRERPSEPSHSAALRLSARQGLPSLAAFAADAGTTVDEILAGRVDPLLSSLAGRALDAPGFVPVAIAPATRTATVGGVPFLLNDFSLARRRWCAGCIAADLSAARTGGEPLVSAAWSRPEWDVRSFVACPTHLRALSERCPACRRRQDWTGPAIDRCRCGADLAAATSAAVADEDVAWERFVIERLAGLPGPSLLAPDTPRLLVSSVERLGFAATAGWTMSRLRATAAERTDARRAGMRVVRGWPGSFRSALDRVSTGVGGDGRPRGLLGAYGWIHGEWAFLPPGTHLDREVRTVLRGHALDNGFVAAGEPVFGEAVPPSISMTAAARLCGMEYTRARRMLDGAGIIPNGVRRGVAFPLRPGDVSDVIRRHRAPSLLEDAAALAVGRSQARVLRARFGGWGGSWSATLLAELRSKAQAADGIDAMRPVAFACRAVGVPIADACGLILMGELPCSRFGSGRGLAGLAVLPAILRSLCRPRIGIEEAARMVGIHHEAMRWLVAAGEVGREDGAGIDRGSLDGFVRRFVPASRLARERGTSSRSLMAMLATLGVRPRFGPPACRQAIYLRSEVGSVLAALSAPRPTTLQ